jgi:hypothetical protein
MTDSEAVHQVMVGDFFAYSNYKNFMEVRLCVMTKGQPAECCHWRCSLL